MADLAPKYLAPALRISLRVSWFDQWQEQPGLWCKALEFASNPSMPEAQLVWRYGTGANPEDQGIRWPVERLNILGYYVKIEVDPQHVADVGDLPTWYGRVKECHDRRDGAALEDGQRKASGQQTFVCWGLESELDLDHILRSVIWNDQLQAEQEIGRAIGFNLGAGRRHDQGDREHWNRSAEVGEQSQYVFSHSLKVEDAYPWSAADIVDYLLSYYGPKDVDDVTSLPFALDYGSEQTAYLETLQPKLAVEGLTIRQVLDTLLSRKRGMGWFVRVDEQENCLVSPFTHFVSGLSLPSGERIDGNAQPVTLDFDRDVTLRQATLRSTEVTQFDQVVVRGDRIGAVVSFDTLEGDGIVADWTDADRDCYNQASSTSEGYAALDRWEKQQRNDNFRQQQIGLDGEHVQRAFSHFKLSDPWDGKCASGGYAVLAQEETAAANPQDDIDLGTNLPSWRAGLRFEKYLPLFEGEDYTGNRVATGKVAISGTRNEYMGPLVLIKTSKSPDPERYQLVEKLSADAENEGTSDNDCGRTWACHLRMREDDAGLILRVSGQARQHLIAADARDFQPCDDTDDVPGDLNWRDILGATVYLLTDEHVEIRAPSNAELADDPPAHGQRIRRLLVQVPDAHLDYIVPHTVVGVKDGQLLSCDSGGVIRSDVARLAAIAALAREWYCRERRTLSLQFRRIFQPAPLGALITTIGAAETAETVNTCVTRLRLDFEAGVTTVQTQYAELDLKAM